MEFNKLFMDQEHRLCQFVFSITASPRARAPSQTLSKSLSNPCSNPVLLSFEAEGLYPVFFEEDP